MQHLVVNFGGIWKFELFLYLGFYFLLRKSGLIFKKSSGNTAAHVATRSRSRRLTPRAMYVVQCHYLSV